MSRVLRAEMSRKHPSRFVDRVCEPRRVACRSGCHEPVHPPLRVSRPLHKCSVGAAELEKMQSNGTAPSSVDSRVVNFRPRLRLACGAVRTLSVRACRVHGLLDVGEGNLVYWEARGNPHGRPRFWSCTADRDLADHGAAQGVRPRSFPGCGGARIGHAVRTPFQPQ